MSDKLWCVYMLQCSDGSLYTGITNDITARLQTHQSGKGAKYTKARRPVRLVYHEGAENRSTASKREAAIKKMPRTEKLALIAGFG
ncbi:MAG TPA: GIY-YIG nuclease family protein [Hellea balneolensis]|uniref:GIY-YIG nuclease family protein n=1 Tax=Hellea balneolensis TaxID=287478 RepID=A0A7C5QV27_9PROT|nr:GIY-YIG nuclease family protein [Hellea balneolensis]